MSLSNPWFILALIATAGLYHLELISILLNLSALRVGIPPRLQSVLSEEDFERTQEYVRAKSALEIAEQSFLLVLMLGFWWSGGFGLLDTMIQGWHLRPVLEGLAVIGIVV